MLLNRKWTLVFKFDGTILLNFVKTRRHKLIVHDQFYNFESKQFAASRKGAETKGGILSPTVVVKKYITR